MTDGQGKNIVASIHQRLMNVSKQSGRLFNDLVLYYAVERFLYRLSISPYAEQVILKGGLMLRVWDTPVTRVTRDIDLLGKLGNDLEQIKQVVRDVCEIAVDDDGLDFDSETVATIRIADDAEYEGVRATFRGWFGKMPLAMQVDFGFSDVITPEPVRITYPAILDHPPAQLQAYNRETVVAEKFEAMVKLGELNSRMKDFFDIWLLAKNFSFEGTVLADAIRSTFERRETEFEVDPACFADRFATAQDKMTQWRSFIKNSRIAAAPEEFNMVVPQVRKFIQPVTNSIIDQRQFNEHWEPGGPWLVR